MRTFFEKIKIHKQEKLTQNIKEIAHSKELEKCLRNIFAHIRSDLDTKATTGQTMPRNFSENFRIIEGKDQIMIILREGILNPTKGINSKPIYIDFTILIEINKKIIGKKIEISTFLADEQITSGDIGQKIDRYETYRHKEGKFPSITWLPNSTKYLDSLEELLLYLKELLGE